MSLVPAKNSQGILWNTPPKRLGISTTFLYLSHREKTFANSFNLLKCPHKKLWGFKVANIKPRRQAVRECWGAKYRLFSHKYMIIFSKAVLNT